MNHLTYPQADLWPQGHGMITKSTSLSINSWIFVVVLRYQPTNHGDSKTSMNEESQTGLAVMLPSLMVRMKFGLVAFSMTPRKVGIKVENPHCQQDILSLKPTAKAPSSYAGHPKRRFHLPMIFNGKPTSHQLLENVVDPGREHPRNLAFHTSTY